MNLDFAKSFSFIFDDDEWIQKVLIAGLIGTIGSVVFGLGWLVVVGWLIEIIRRVIADEETVLPDWENIGTYFMDGLKFAGVTLIWSMPLILIGFCVFAPTIAFAAASAEDGSGGGILIAIASTCFPLLAITYALVLSALTGPLYGLLAEDHPFGNLVNPRYAFDYFKRNVGEYLIAIIIGGLIASFVGSLGSIACGIGIIFTVPIGQAMMGHLLGQAHKNTIGQSVLLAEDI